MTSIPGSAVHIDDLTDEQVLALSEEDLQRLVRYRMAEEGIKILDRPVEPVWEELPVPDVTVWAVGDFEFTDHRSAEVVAETVTDLAGARTNTGYDYSAGGYGSALHVLPVRDTEAAVARKRAYSPEAWAVHKDALGQQATAKKEFRDRLREFEDAERQAEGVREEVYGRHTEVLATHERRQALVARYAEYLDLAEGQPTVAMAFLRKAYLADDADLAYLYKAVGFPRMVEDPS